MNTCAGRGAPTRYGAARTILLVLLFAPAAACDLLSDADFATLGSEASPWAISDGARAVREGQSARLSRHGDGFALLWQDLPGEQCPPGAVLRASVTVAWTGSEDGRGAWCSLHFYDAFGQRIGTAASGVAVEVGKPTEAQVVTTVPDRTTRASFVCVVSGRGEALFSRPVARVEPAPRAHAYPASGVECEVASEPGYGAYHGIGLVTHLSDRTGGTALSARPAFWRVTVPWPDLGVAGSGAGALAERIGRAYGADSPPLWLALGQAEPRFVADPERCAQAAAALARALGDRTAFRWISPAAEPDTCAGAPPARVALCVAALRAALPQEVLPAGPDELRGTEWVAATRTALGGLDAPVSAHLDLDRRDLGLAEERIAELAQQGVTGLMLNVSAQDPHDGTYAASDERVLDTLRVALAAADQGVRWLAVEPEPSGLLPVVTSLAAAQQGVRHVRIVRLAPEGRLAAVWTEVAEETGWVLTVVNPYPESVRLSARCPVSGRTRRATRIVLSAQDGFAPQRDVLPMGPEQLVDLVPGLAVVTYAELP